MHKKILMSHALYDVISKNLNIYDDNKWGIHITNIPHEFDIKELKRRILEIRDHHYERLDEMLKCVDAGATAWDVAGRVQWTTGTLADFDPFTQRAAVGETLAHLEYLFEEGRLSKVKRE